MSGTLGTSWIKLVRIPLFSVSFAVTFQHSLHSWPNCFAHVRVLAASKPRTAHENSKHLLSILQTALQLLCENFACAKVPVGYAGFLQQVVCGFQNTYV